MIILKGGRVPLRSSSHFSLFIDWALGVGNDHQWLTINSEISENRFFGEFFADWKFGWRELIVGYIDGLVNSNGLLLYEHFQQINVSSRISNRKVLSKQLKKLLRFQSWMLQPRGLESVFDSIVSVNHWLIIRVSLWAESSSKSFDWILRQNCNSLQTKDSSPVNLDEPNQTKIFLILTFDQVASIWLAYHSQGWMVFSDWHLIKTRHDMAHHIRFECGEKKPSAIRKTFG